MSSIRYYLLSVIAIFIISNSCPTSVFANENKSPEEVVAFFQDGLVKVMKVSETLDTQQRYNKLEPTLGASFHFPLMVQIAVGTYWRDAGQELRLKVTNSFRRLSISTLATLFDGYSGESFEYRKKILGPYATVLVVTNLLKSDKTRIEISYVTRKFPNGWRIIDVILDGGISELKVRQSEYRQILKTDGISGLIDLLDKKTKELMLIKNL